MAYENADKIGNDHGQHSGDDEANPGRAQPGHEIRSSAETNHCDEAR